MSSPVVAAERPIPQERWLWLIFAAAWLVNFGFSAVGWDNTLINGFQFRQSQTAITTAYFPPGHFPLAYETPLFGPPWSLPLELPVFQATVATLSAVTGLPLDPAGRLVSWLFFQLSLPAFYLLLGSVGLRRSTRLLCLSLVLTSPLYLFFSRAFLIESTALCFCAWFLAAFARWLSEGRFRWLALAAAAGALGACIKVTTMTVFGFAAVVYALGLWFAGRRAGMPAGGPGTTRIAFRTVVAMLIPAAAGLAWLVYSTRIRALNPEAGFLNSHFGFWSFGDLPQRLSWRYWSGTAKVWSEDILSQAGLAVLVYLAVRQRIGLRSAVGAALVAFLGGQLIFANLYLVHNYYFYASGVFLLLALGLLLAARFEDLTRSRWERVGLLLIVLVAQLATYFRGYFPSQLSNIKPAEWLEVVHDATRPDDLVVILGFDWDATTPYYLGRRAMMLTNGREFDRAKLKASIDRLDASKVGAVVLKGWMREDVNFVRETMGRLDLGEMPVLRNVGEEIAVWFPRARHFDIREHFPLRPFATVDVVPERPVPGAKVSLGLREIGQRPEFHRFSPHPVRATSTSELTEGQVGPDRVLNAHCPTELVFRPRAGATTVTMTFGIHDGAYTGQLRTDGVEFQVVARTARGPERVLFTRILDPANHAADQGTQRAEVKVKESPGVELVFRTLPGPRNDYSFDWAYWGEVQIR